MAHSQIEVGTFGAVVLPTLAAISLAAKPSSAVLVNMAGFKGRSEDPLWPMTLYQAQRFRVCLGPY